MALTLEDLQEVAKIEQDRNAGFQYHINVCVAAGCLSCQSAFVKDALEKEVSRRGWESWCNVKGVGCLGLCAAGPLLAVDPDGIYYRGATVSDVSDILDSLGGAPVSRLDCSGQSPFFSVNRRSYWKTAAESIPSASKITLRPAGIRGSTRRSER